ncbi:hypothetical protein SLS58_002146 [Diplodia intermedia]|uniref:Uncharacterized protein n=1 Tax=Diplodia intermedia TaxID=856260 RepID=A0ABR3TZT6_9PEZI
MTLLLLLLETVLDRFRCTCTCTCTYPPPPSYGAIDTDLEANVVIAKPVKLSSSSAKNADVAAAEVRLEPAWMAWRRERMQILGPVQQDKRVLLWAWALLCIFAIVLGVGLGLAYGRKTPAGLA